MTEESKVGMEMHSPSYGNMLPIVRSKSVDDLVDCMQILDALPASTEGEFLHIGSKLRNFYDRAEQISAVAGSVAGLMSGDDISGTIDGLHGLLKRMKAHLIKSESEIKLGIARLKQIADILDDIDGQMEELAGITRSLRALGFSTMIQNASLSRPDGGIQLLGEDVKKLSASVAEKVTSIGGGTKNLSGIIRSSVLTLNSLEAAQRIKAAAVMKNMAASIKSLEEKYALSASAARGISASSEDITQSLGRIVTSLQFHDITRQMFENSKKAFDGALSNLARQNNGGGGLSPYDEQTLRQFFYRVTALCEREALSLGEGREVFVTAVCGVKENLGITAANVRETIKRAEKITKADNSSTKSFLSEIEGVLSSVSSTVSALSESTLVKKELSETVKKATGLTREMTGLIQGIEEIGDEVELIAFNAAIKADHIGIEGRPLGVIAEFVQRISAEAPTHTTSISDLLKSIATSAEELSYELVSTEEDSGGEISGMSRTLHAMVGSLRALNKKVISSFAEINEAGEGLSGDIEEVIGDISVHTHVSRAVDSVLGSLKMISSAIRGAMPDMASASNLPGQPRLPRETVSDMHGSGKRVYVDPREFGDNVELF